MDESLLFEVPCSSLLKARDSELLVLNLFFLNVLIKCLSFGEKYVYKEELIGATGALTCMAR